MSISYPLSTPADIGFAQIELSAINAIATSRSPFTFATQVHAYSGEMWSANVTLPPVRKLYSEPWVAFLLSLRGQFGTFLLGDPNMTSPRGSVSSLAISTPAVGDRTLNVTMTGSLLAGDYIQLGSGSGARLHKVLEDQTGSGTLEIWPSVRAVTTAVSFTDTKGVFRLATNQTNWSINESSVYGIQFDAMEDL